MTVKEVFYLRKQGKMEEKRIEEAETPSRWLKTLKNKAQRGEKQGAATKDMEKTQYFFRATAFIHADKKCRRMETTLIHADKKCRRMENNAYPSR